MGRYCVLGLSGGILVFNKISTTYIGYEKKVGQRIVLGVSIT